MEYTITLYNNSSVDTPNMVCTISDATLGFSASWTLVSGGSKAWTVPFTIPADFAGDDFVNTASVTCSPTGFPNVYTDSASHSIELFQPSINLTKSAETLSKAGDPVAYTITLYNNSSADTPDLVCTITDATIGFTQAVTLASGANAPYTVPFTIPADFVGDDFANTASVTCSPAGLPERLHRRGILEHRAVPAGDQPDEER